MKPNDIKRLILAAEEVAESQPHPIPMFLLSWTAWEALRTRFLRLVIKRMGWTIKDADAVIRDLKISSMESAAKVMVNLGMIAPSQWPGRSGRIWRKLLEAQLVRHRLAHGFDALDPKLIRSCGQLVLASLHHRAWFEDMAITTPGEAPFNAGDLLAGQATTRVRDGHDLAALRTKLDTPT